MRYFIPCLMAILSSIATRAQVAAISGPTIICPGTAVTYTDATSGGAWSSSSAIVAVIGSASGVAVGIATGVVTISYTVGASVATYSVTVTTAPSTISGPPAICNGFTATYTSTGGGTWSSSFPSVAVIGTATGIASGVSAGTTTLTYSLGTGCYVTRLITVNPVPPAITGFTTVCAGGSTTLSNAATGGTWTSSNTSLGTVASTTGVVTGIAAGTLTITYTLGTGCYATIPVTVTTAPAPITGTTTICAGGTTTLSNATGGGIWTSSNVGVATIGFSGTVTGVSAGTSTISYTVGTTGCSASVVVTVLNSVPTTYSVAGGGGYCSGGTGVSVGLSGSQTSVLYQLYNGASAVGSPMMGTGSAISFPAVTTAGTYTVTANAGTSCSAAMTGSATVTINALPTAFTVTGGGTYSGTGPGIAIGLSGSTLGVNYQLILGATVIGSAIAGTGGAISFGLFTTAGTYTIIGTNSTTGCVATMSGTAVITLSSGPTIYTVTGGGPVCAGGSGIVVGLSNSQTGVVYQLYNGATAVGSPVSGTGAAISFGLQTAPGSYTVVANPGTSSATPMSGSVIINPLPFAFTVTGGGTYSGTGPGVAIGLSGSQTGTTYQVYLGTSLVAALTGTGSAISFGLFTVAGTYTVVATNVSTSCTGSMTGSAVITLGFVPTVYAVTGGGSFCSGGAGVVVGLSGSQSGVIYQLYNGTTAVGIPINGTGAAISFGLQTAGGTYTVVANPGTSSSTAMSGSATVTATAAPNDYAFTSGGSYCAGGGGGVAVGITGSDIGVNYQLYRTTTTGTTAIGSVVAGTGSAILFGMQTIAGVYTVVATGVLTGCTRTLSGSTTLIFHAPPAIITISGGGTYCAGGTGVPITMPASAVGVNYQLYLGGTIFGSPVPGVGYGLSFGLQTTPGVYTVVATDLSTGCTSNMTGSVTVSTTPSPTVYTVTGGGSYCAGGTGMAVGLSGSSLGISYRLYRGGTPIGSLLPGSGSAISFGAQTIPGTYTVTALNTSTFCTSNMTGSATVSLNTVHIYTVTGGGGYCAGGSGVTIGLSNSDIGVNYQLRNGTTLIGSPVAGTGGAISFGMQTAAGTYTVIASDATTGCTGVMSGSAAVTINTMPTAYAMTGGGGYCTGGTGVVVGLSGSQTAVTYQLYLGTSPVGSVVAGTGGAISFGLRTAAGVYTAVATAVGGCSNNMTGSATVTISAPPTVYTMTGSGSFCTGGSGVALGLSGSQTGVNYQLYRGTVTVGSPVAGTGSAIGFGLQSVAGTYTVMATTTTGCTASMSGSSILSTLPAPTICPMTGGGGYCSGGAGVAIGLGASIGGVSYQLYRGTTAVGSPVMGGIGLTFGLQTVAGVYTAIATNSSGCSSTMSGSATVTVYSLPTVYSVTGGGSYCAGSTGVHIGVSGSSTGTTYRLYLGVVPVSSYVPGTGAPIDFGLYTTTGTYTVIATNSVTGCTSTMTGSAVVSVNPTPTISGTIYTVAPAGSIALTGSPSGGTWMSSNPAIASIGATSGIVSGVSLGSVNITYTSAAGCIAIHSVAVTPTGFRLAHGGTTGVTTLTNIENVSIVPNPNKGSFSIKGQVSVGTDEVALTITNMLGQRVFYSTIKSTNGTIDEQVWPGEALPNGTYLLTLMAGADTKVMRLVVER